MTKIRLLADKNHVLEIELQRTRHEKMQLQTLLDDSERRMKSMKSSVDNYSQEVSVRSSYL